MAFDCRKCGKHYPAGWPARDGICYRCLNQKTPMTIARRAEKAANKQKFNNEKAKKGNKAKKSDRWEPAKKHYQEQRDRKLRADYWTQVAENAERERLPADAYLAKTYGERDLILLKAGFKNYREYLASDLWLRIRQAVYYRFGHVCSMCGDKANQIHHAQYDLATIQGHCLDHLYPLCAVCHEAIEMLDGKKVTLRHAMDTFRSVIGKPSIPTQKETNDLERELAKREYLRLQGKRSRPKGGKFASKFRTKRG